MIDSERLALAVRSYGQGYLDGRRLAGFELEAYASDPQVVVLSLQRGDSRTSVAFPVESESGVRLGVRLQLRIDRMVTELEHAVGGGAAIGRSGGGAAIGRSGGRAAGRVPA